MWEREQGVGHLTAKVMSILRFGIGFVAALGAALPALAALPARPGTLNFVEGNVLVDGRPLTSNTIGAANVPAGSVLRTGNGKAEVLLTPGVFLRVGSNSEVRMIQSGLMDTRIQVDRGVALLEANDLHKENNIRIAAAGLNAAIKDEGLYRFDAENDSVAVFKGKAEVRQDDETVELKKGRTVLAAPDAELKVEKFDVGEAKKTDELYQWSNLRSKYLAQASAVMARRVVGQPGLWSGAGWYWDPWMRSYSWLPSRSAFSSPFGYGFYSPWSYYTRPVYVVPRYGMRRPGYVGGVRRGVHPGGGIGHSRPGGRVRGR